MHMNREDLNMRAIGAQIRVDGILDCEEVHMQIEICDIFHIMYDMQGFEL